MKLPCKDRRFAARRHPVTSRPIAVGQASRRRRWLELRRALVVASCALAAGCGGGGASTHSGATLAPLEVTLSATLTAAGTYLRCDASASVNLSLERTSASTQRTESMSCPQTRLLAGDFELSTWRTWLDDGTGSAGAVLATAATSLPAPIILQDGARLVVVPIAAPQVTGDWGLRLDALSSAGNVIASYANPSTVDANGLPSLAVIRWQWTATIAGTPYRSVPAAVRSFAETDLGFWGALAIAGTDVDGHAAILTPAGLDALNTGRTFRDLRVVDLDNDDRQDVVSNVYGSGCAMIGLRQGDGSYAFQTPLRKDGSCIGGHGETIVVADFDGDGLVDILLPSYERFDYLHNLGHGRFEEVADDLGIAFPDYVPHVEGAAAVDINLDGHIDLVIASEVLLNDGRGHFLPLANPFGPLRVHDEGMSVADLDGDGFFDIVKNDPSLGPRIFWGGADRRSFTDGGWLFGGASVLSASYGVAVADLKGNGLADVVMAGGEPAGRPPVLCAQRLARNFDCLFAAFPTHDGALQDLLLATDLNGDGAPDLVSRFGTIRTFVNSAARAYVFRVDLRDAAGHANQFGRAIRANCAVGGSLIGLAFVDGGNGYMAQGSYPVTFASDWCPRIVVEIATAKGITAFGPFGPGTQEIRLPGA